MLGWPGSAQRRAPLPRRPRAAMRAPRFPRCFPRRAALTRLLPPLPHQNAARHVGERVVAAGPRPHAARCRGGDPCTARARRMPPRPCSCAHEGRLGSQGGFHLRPRRRRQRPRLCRCGEARVGCWLPASFWGAWTPARRRARARAPAHCLTVFDRTLPLSSSSPRPSSAAASGPSTRSRRSTLPASAGWRPWR